MKVKELMEKDPKYAKEVRLFAEFMDWDLKEIEEMPPKVYLAALAREFGKSLQGLREVLKA